MNERSTLKHYKLLARLGEGGMGVVYRAEDTRLGRTVALKVLPRELAENEERARRFEREARLASSISHPGVATVYDFDRDGDVAFLTMELVKGRNLRELLREGTLPVRQILDCAVQVAEALSAAHREGVIHRDLKPENVVASESGYYKVLDFGVARREHLADPRQAPDTKMETLEQITTLGTLIGTVTYMSPEQVQGLPVDARSDIFSFGSLLYELITGKPAFRGNTAIAIAHEVVYGTPEPIRSLRPEIPRGLERVVLRCIEKDPDRRYASAEELSADLRALHLESLSGPRSGFRWFSRPAGGRRALWIGGGLLAAALVIGVVGTAWRYLQRPAPEAGALPAIPAVGAFPASQDGRPRIVVALFENTTGDPEADWLVRGLPEMLTTDLSSTGDLAVIATRHLYDLLALSGKDGEEVLDRSTATELARWAGANIVISGSVLKLGASYRIDAQAYDTASGTVLVAHKVEGAEVLQMVDEMTTVLRRGLRVAMGQKGGLQAVATSSEKAFRAYVRGKSMYEDLKFAEATEEFRRAVGEDPEFALGRLRLAMSEYLEGDLETAVQDLDQAAERAERMPEKERLLTRALHALLRDNDPEAGMRYLDELVSRHPGDGEALVWRARSLARFIGDPLRANHDLRQAIRRDPNDLQAIAELAVQLADLGDVEAAEGILRETIQRNPDAEASLTKVLARRPSRR